MNGPVDSHEVRPGTADRDAAIAANARAARIALLAAGVLGQFALEPLLGSFVWTGASVLLLAAGISSVHLPLVIEDRVRERKLTQLRQLLAIAVMLACGMGAVYGLRTGRPEPQNLGLLLVGAQIAHALAMRTLREAGLGCGVVVAMFAIAAVFAGDPVLVLVLAPGLACIAVAAALLHRATLLERVGASFVGGPMNVVRACLAPAALAVVMSILTFFVSPSSIAAHPHRLTGIGGGNGVVGSAPRTLGRYFDAGDLDLRSRGTLPSGAVLSTPADAPGYWLGAVYDSFDGIAWRTPSFDSAGIWVRSSGSVQFPPSAVSGAGRVNDVTVLAPDLPPVVFAPGSVTSYRGPGIVVSDVDGSLHLVGGVAPAVGERSYQVTSTLLAPSDAELRAAAGPDPSDPKWTALPSTLAPRVTTLARDLTQTSATRFDKVQAIENYLKANEKYDLNSPEPALGDDAVDDFVFVSHRGFCEQFATAAVVMLRSVGVPARLATGFAFGDTQSKPGRRIFHGSDAHAWVQVYYPGIGWVSSEATGTNAVRGNSLSVRQRISHTLTAALRHLPGGRVGALLASCLLLVVVVAIGFLLGRRWRRARRFGTDGSAEPGPVLAAYLRLEAALEKSGRAREPDETLAEFARRLGGLVASSSEVAFAMRCLERECYARGSRRPSPADATTAIDVFERLRAAAGSQTVALVRQP